MTENKRFVDYFDKDHNYIIQDLWNEDEYQVGFVNCDEDLFLELVNELNDENDILKQKLKTKYIVNKQYEELQRLKEENEQLKSAIEKLSKFENNGEHIRLSINIETGELQRHIYATGQWFGDFDRVLCTNWITEKDYQKFIDRVIEIYNTEFKGDVE